MDSVQEEWRAVVGYEGKYEVSNHGRVRSLDRRVTPTRVHPNGQFVPGRMLKPGNDKDGYQLVRLCGKTQKVHRLVVSAFIGEIPDGMHVNHIDCIKSNNVASNLEIVTPSQNILYNYSHGGQVPLRGKGHYAAKLTEDQVREIRASDMTKAELSRKYKLHYMTISDIIKRKNWKHI